jgi:ribosomal protein L18E
MRRSAGSISLLFVAACAFVVAQEPSKPQPPTKVNLSGTQEEIARTYKALEGTLLKIANKLERTGTKEGVEKARVIMKALQEAREKDIAINLTQLAELTKDNDVAKLKNAIEKGTSVKGDLEALLTALLSERSSKEHVEFLKNLIKELEKAIRDQKVAISKNQSSAVEKEDAKKAQEVAEKQVQKILDQIKAYEEKTTGKMCDDKKGAQAGKDKKNNSKADSKDAKPGDGKPQDGKSGEGKPGEGKPGEGKPGEGKSGEGKPQEGQQGDKKNQPGEQQEQQEGGIPRQRIEDAKDAQSQAGKKIDKNERQEAIPDQEDAKTKLEQARKRLEEILRQMREEEIERVLADLQKRCEKMLQMQEIVNAGTKQIHSRVYALGKTERDDELGSRRLGEDEDKIIVEADSAIAVIEAEGTAVAFTEVFHQVRNDMLQVSRRLGRVDVGQETLMIEEDIVTTLKEMIEALKKQQQEQRDRKQSQQNNGNPSPQELIDKLAELRMIRAMQLRVNARTVQWAKRYQGEEARDLAIVQELQDLAKRQDKIFRVTDNVAKGRNK